MGRLFSAVLLSAVLLLPAQKISAPAQPVFFSMLFPQLMPDGTPGGAAEATAGEVVPL